MPERRLLIFTDLDGTLLDHATYSWTAAKPALQKARELAVPVIPCTSKTFMECLSIEASLRLKTPLIFENGSGVALPKEQFRQPPNRKCNDAESHWIFSFGMNYGQLREILASVKSAKRYQFRGFGDMSAREVAEATGLSEQEAELAQQRRHSEPLIWLDDAKSFDRFREDIKARGLNLTRGGRFVHVMEASNKGKAMLWLATLYEFLWKTSPKLIALGDSNNDLPMLSEADVAVIVRNPHKAPLQYEPSREQRVIVTEGYGPGGWNEAVLDILSGASPNG